MRKDQGSEDTEVVATYNNRHDAEVAMGYLKDQNIDSFVVADDVHPPLQLTEGVKLLVMHTRVQDAREALKVADMLPRTGSEKVDEVEGPGIVGEPEEPPASARTSARNSAWIYIIAFVLIIAAVVIGIMLTS